MDNWQQFLKQQGAIFSNSCVAEVTGFEGARTETMRTSFAAPLLDLGLIALSGDEAAHFLHNQLTNDVEHLGLTEARLAGYCSPKGRLLTTMLMWKTADAIILQLPREILPAIQKRLQMFVMRAKAKLTEVSEQHVILGLTGTSAATLLLNWFAVLPANPYETVTAATGTLIRVADAFGAPRFQLITSPELAMSIWPQLTQALPAAGSAAWRLTSIHAGIPVITLATQEKFVPQMINFEVIGGVNFKKGCYPGQEIVARSQYLGKLKRRMMLATIATEDAKAGMEVFSSSDPEQPCGMIVNAECSSPGDMDCLVEIKTAAIDAGSIHLGAAGGAVLQFKALPYALPDAE